MTNCDVSMCVCARATTTEVAALSFQGKYGHNYAQNAIRRSRQDCYNIVVLKRDGVYDVYIA